jgi:hypothetical protein
MTAVNSTATGYKNLYTADSTGSNSGQPATNNVRSGTIYGPNSELTGTCAVPGASSVAFGVPVDATTGTAVLTPESLRTAVGLASANLDAQLDALPTATEIAQAVWNYTTRTLSDVSAIVSGVWSAATRTVTGGTIDNLVNVDVPTGAEIAAAVRTELSTELGRIDVATSTRLAPDGTLARVTLTDTATTLTDPPDVPTPEEIAAEVWSTTTRTVTGGTVDTLTNRPDVPSETDIAEAVRTELATELGRIDVATSTRLAPDGTLARVTLTDTTTAVTDTAAIAEAVRTELTPELARVANASTTQEVADIVEGAAAVPGG